MPYTLYHPVYLHLEGRPVLIVGGGVVAIEKLNSLIPSGAKITVVSPEVRSEVLEWHQAGVISWVQREFQPSDIETAYMIH